MKRYLVLFVLIALLLPSLVMPASAQSNKKSKQAAARTSKPAVDKAEEEEGESADIPAFARGMVTEEEYFERRDGAVAKKRGLDDPNATRLRVNAIRQMERQEREVAATTAARLQGGERDASIRNSTSWTTIGPAPLPNGQTEGTPTPVSGRTIAVAIHPTNPNIAYVGTAQGGVYRTTDGGATWLAIFDRALSLAVGALALAPSDPTILYVGTGEPNRSCDSFFGVGVYRIRDAETLPKVEGPFNSDGTNDVFTGRASSANIAVHPTDPNTIFIGTVSGVGGKGCEAFGNGTLPPLPARALYRSTNMLSATPTFQKMTTITATNVVVGNASHIDVIMDPTNPNRVLTTVEAVTGAGNLSGGVFLSTNALAANPTFTNTLSLNGVRAELALTNAGGATNVYVASAESNGRLRRSTDGGATWSAVLAGANGFCGGQCVYDIALDVSPVNALEVLIGGNVTGASTKLVAKSVNGGTAFVNNATGVHADNHFIRYAPSNANIAYMGTDGGIYKSTNAGTSWTSMNTMGFNATQFQSLDVHPINQYFTLGGTQDNGTELLEGNNVWRRADFGDGGYALIDQNATDTTAVTMYHTYFNQTNAMGFSRVTLTAQAVDNGWTFFGCGFAGSIPNGMTCTATAIEFYAPIARGPGNPNTLYFGSDVLYRSVNSGTTMTKVSQEPIVSAVPITDIGIAPSNDNVRLVGLRNGQVWGTNTGATTLSNLTTAGMPTRYIGNVVIDPSNPAVAYVAYTGFALPAGQHIWKTSNLTSATPTFAASGLGIPDVPVNAMAVDPMNSQIVYAGTDIGVYRSIDGGASWLPFSDGLPRVAVFDMTIQNANRILRVATHGRGMWQVALAPAQRIRGDFDQDGQTEIAIWQGNSSGDWVFRNSSTNYLRTHPNWGKASLSDRIVPGDYDNDNKVDFAVWRENEGNWYIANSADLSITVRQWGQPGDIPVQGDYDGDGKTDFAIFRPSGNEWWIINSSSNTATLKGWGASGDKPVPADYDGDGKTDIAVWRPSEGNWYIINSGNNTVTVQGWGVAGDRVVPGDYDGDDKADLAVFRPTEGNWYIRRSTGGNTVQNWGNASDVLVPGDYDKDGRFDLAVWRGSEGNWYLLLSSGGSRIESLGFPNDTPVPSGYIPVP